jgi:hypothetical protein
MRKTQSVMRNGLLFTFCALRLGNGVNYGSE